MYQGLKFLALRAKVALNELIADESGEVNIVAIVVLIGIAVLLAIVFKDKITELLDSLFNSITDSANKAVTGN